MTTVYIVNKSAHDFSEAKEWGNISFMTEGRIDRFNLVDMHRLMTEALRHSVPSDYIVPCSLTTLTAVACSVFVSNHGKLNLLLFRKSFWEDGKKGKGIYLERNLVFDN